MKKHLEEAIFLITKHDTPVGVMVSGGADSALLLYLILSNYKSKVHIFSTSPGPRKEVDPTYSLHVVRRCAELTGNYNFEHHLNYTESYAGPAIFDLATQYFNEGRINFIFTGISKNPPLEVQEGWPSQPEIALNGRDPNETRDPHCHIEDGKIYPWTNLDKKDLAEIYKEYNLTDSLFEVTRSCVNIDVGLQHCGECWWCKEREWAFGYISKKNKA